MADSTVMAVWYAGSPGWTEGSPDHDYKISEVKNMTTAKEPERFQKCFGSMEKLEEFCNAGPARGLARFEVWTPPKVEPRAVKEQPPAPSGYGVIRSTQERQAAERKAAVDAADPPGQWAAPVRQTPEQLAVLRERQIKRALGRWD